MLDTASKLIAFFDRRERLYLAVLSVAVVVMAFLQMVSVAAVLPFLTVAADPALIGSNPWLAWAYETFGFTSADRFLIGLGAAAFVALIVANAWIAMTQWAMFRFVHGRTHSLSMKLMARYLGQPYEWFLRRNSSELGKNVLNEVEQVTLYVLRPGLLLASRAIVVLALLGLVVVFDPPLAFVVAAVLGTAYGGIFFGMRRMLSALGAARVKANAARFKTASEAFGAIKEIKLRGNEGAILARFRRPSAVANRAFATGQIIGELPRYALETIAFGGVLVVAVTLLARGQDLHNVIPVLGLYVFVGYRLMPNLQHVFKGLTDVRHGAPAVDNLYRELMGGAAPRPAASAAGRDEKTRTARPAREPLPLRERLELRDLAFAYPGAGRPALQDVSLTIPANTTVGIMGPTGSGKTTLVDLILGLLRPTSGEILVDGVALAPDNLARWQRGLGYVPQAIWLADDSVAANIAFGVEPGEIDMAAVERAARLAQIHDFVASELPEGYDTAVGERGIRLSGGQRQRIGIARALYHDPGVLVLDEATSALDNETEAAVMESVGRLSGSRTIILVAHRESTVRGCDQIVSLPSSRLGESQPTEQIV